MEQITDCKRTTDCVGQFVAMYIQIPYLMQSMNNIEIKLVFANLKTKDVGCLFNQNSKFKIYNRNSINEFSFTFQDKNN